MPRPIVESFIQALQESESRRDPQPVAALFGDAAELSNLAHAEPQRGHDGAVRFWGDYLKTFGEVRSTFSAVIEEGESACLEWTSEGTLPNGRPIRYRGVSLLDFDGDRVTKFRTYYDSAAFVTPPAAG